MHFEPPGLRGCLRQLHTRPGGSPLAETHVNNVPGHNSYADHHGAISYLVCDEAQFYEPEQVDQLARVVDELGADVHALGLLTDFRGRLFPGTARLLEVADERCELQVEARCWCGARATHNARLLDGTQVYDGDVVVVGDVASDAEVSYELLCRRHWLAGETGRLDPAGVAALAGR
ncbi:MAG TPA: hypothetical protein VHK88_08410 [Aquihabitans sp.]|nr:hypothetical protein [Aquihabitans sp.]